MNIFYRLFRKPDPDLESKDEFQRKLTKDKEHRREVDARLRAIEVGIDVQSRGKFLRDH